MALPRRENGTSSSSSQNAKPKRPRGRRNVKKEERKGEALTGSLEPAVLHSVLKDMHEAFVLFHGSIREAIHPDGNTTETDVISRTRKKLRKAIKIRDGLENDHITSTHPKDWRRQRRFPYSRRSWKSM